MLALSGSLTMALPQPWFDRVVLPLVGLAAASDAWTPGPGPRHAGPDDPATAGRGSGPKLPADLTHPLAETRLGS